MFRLCSWTKGQSSDSIVKTQAIFTATPVNRKPNTVLYLCSIRISHQRMTDRQQKIIRIIALSLLGLFVLAGIGGAVAFSQRERLLKTAIERATKKVKRDYKLDVTIGKARFTGWRSVGFEQIVVVPEARDTIARIARTEVSVNVWPLLFGKIALSDLSLENGLIQVVKRDSLSNLDTILKRRRTDSTKTGQTDTPKRVNLANVADNLIDELLSKIPNNLDIENLEFRLIDIASAKPSAKNRRDLAPAGSSTPTDSVLRPIRSVTVLTERAVIDNQAVSSTFRINGTEATWHVTGQADPADRKYNLALFAEGQQGRLQPLELKYLETRYKLKLQADTLRVRLDDVDRADGEFRLDGAGSVRNLIINHPAIARTDVVVPTASMDAHLFVGENYVGIDSSSVIHLGEIAARPFLKYTLSSTPATDTETAQSDKRQARNAQSAGSTGTSEPQKVGTIYDFQLHTDQMDAQALFNSFPQGLFESVQGMRVSGKLKYDLALHLDTTLPDSVQFDSGLTPENFRILQFGGLDFSKINNSFIYTPYEKGQPVRDIVVGPENPDFTPLSSISSNLRNAVLTSEDYSFFTHKGFNEKAFRVSIATNFKEKAFKRGASTVSMQLVKNVFLSRNKTLSRKVEEILIVWLIENQRLVPKERMYEVYLNIIEWGRNVYGIGEAARYYFDKTPAQLELGESIFLAFVIPSPKRALDWFLPDGSLQTRNVRGYFRIIGRIMARRGLTPPEGETDSTGTYGFYNVRLRPALRRQVEYADSLDYFPDDSLMVLPGNQLDPDEVEVDEGGTGVGNFLRDLFPDKRKRRADATNTDVPRPESGTATANIETTPPADTTKTQRQLRQEKRAQRQQQKAVQKKADEGLLN